MATVADLFAANESAAFREEARQRAWEEGLAAAHPALAALQQRKKELLVAGLQRVLQDPAGKEAIKEEIAEQTRKLELEILAYKQAHGVHEYTPAEACPLCGGSGYAEGRLCSCMRTRAYTEVFGGRELSALPGSFEAYQKEIFGSNAEQARRTGAIKAFLEAYAKEFPRNPKKQLLFCGRAGLGKSFLLHALLKELSAKEQDICCISAGRLFEYFHQHRLGEGPDLALLYEAQVLAIDDLGSEPMTQNVTREYFFELLCERAQNGVYTMVVTNHTVEQLAERYTDRVRSRLVSAKDSHVLQFAGEDLRLAR